MECTRDPQTVCWSSLMIMDHSHHVGNVWLRQITRTQGSADRHSLVPPHGGGNRTHHEVTWRHARTHHNTETSHHIASHRIASQHITQDMTGHNTPPMPQGDVSVMSDM
mmetsp:Transcript_26649/g.63385  ORF Transcript_26649/g.63385 Transcript_26649/m.63385 type:complete len:109 (+) Transcript_26649:37-363(+)